MSGRLGELLDSYGDDTVEAAFVAFSNRAEAMMREEIRALPDGTYVFEDYLDNDGITPDKLTIALDLTIRGDEMVLDFSRSSGPCAGPLNIAYSTAAACCYVALKHVFTSVPANAGCLRPIEFIIPDTTLLGVKPPKPQRHPRAERDPAPECSEARAQTKTQPGRSPPARRGSTATISVAGL